MQPKKAGVWEKVVGKLDLIQKSIKDNKFAIGYLTLADFVIA